MILLRTDLLEGCAVAMAGRADDAIAQGLRDLGGRVESLDGQTSDDEEEVGRWAGQQESLRALVFDARRPFADGGPDALIVTMHQAWLAVREVAAGALIESPEPGKVVLVGPASDAGPHAQAVCAALENLARTLSVEWARYEVSTVMVAPRPGLEEARLAELVAFLCSPAADYVSGCRLDLG